jgi:AcrR family transcriptional regulator
MNDSTKSIILEKAHKLFADRGVNGVSVREIAKECDVNIAAINYHFTNKDNLYIETIRHSMQQTHTEIESIYNSLDVKNVENITVAVYEHFMNNAEDLRTGFKLVISNDKYHDHLGEDMIKFRGPPGGEFFVKCLKNEFSNSTDEDIEWAVRIIFTSVIHKALVMCNSAMSESIKKAGFSEQTFLDDLSRLVKVIKNDLS